MATLRVFCNTKNKGEWAAVGTATTEKKAGVSGAEGVSAQTRLLTPNGGPHPGAALGSIR